MRLNDLIKNVEVEYIKGNREIEISGVAYDSRKVKKGDLFVCISGFKVDGHQYISQAISQGAVAVIVEKTIEAFSETIIKVANSRRALALVSAAFFDYPSSKFKLIGVTGTNGKTTTTYLVKTILEQSGSKVGLIGTNQNMIGDKILSDGERTTPESFELQELFHEMVQEKVDYVVMEVSSHSLELNRVDGCDFEVGIFTNLTQDHLDFHITMDNYLKAKTKLFKQCRTGIVNIDDAAGEYILKHGTCNMVTFAINKQADIKANNVELSAKGVRFMVNASQIDQEIQLGIPGQFSVYNALGSIGACLAVGVDIENIDKALRVAKGVPGRAQVVDTDRDFTVIIDYAHTPDGLENILGTVRGFVKRKLVTVFGCGGDRDRTKRPIMGKIAKELSDFCIVTSDNPRTEEPMHIIDDILQGMNNVEGQYIVIENRLEAIQYALEHAQKDDVIVIAGKGHETYQEINGVKYPFHEEEIVRDLLQRK